MRHTNNNKMPGFRGSGGQPGPILVDSHVHFYGGFDRTLFFDSALSNFGQGAKELGLRQEPLLCLWFTETWKDDYFRQFAEEVDRPSRGPWSFQRTEERCSLYACRDGKGEILLIAGRQIKTKEGLEVLAVGSHLSFPRGMAFREALERVREAGAVPIIPWGFGKWWFRRGALVNRLLKSSEPGSFFLGDNSGRPGLWRHPGHFGLARAKGFVVLAGSDPLPFPDQATKAGRYGFLLEGELDRSRPAEGLKRLARGIATEPLTFGRLEGILSFCRNQWGMQFGKQGKWRRPL